MSSSNDTGSSAPRADEPIHSSRHELLDDPEGLRYGVAASGASIMHYGGWTARWAGDGQLVWSGPAGEARALAERAVFAPLRALFESTDRVAVHGSALVVDGRCWVIMGESGAGKSTTVLGWMRRGARLLSDDRTQLAAGVVVPEPLCGMRLWPHVGDPPGALRWMPMPGRGDKRWWLLDEAVCARDPARPAGLVLLSPQEGEPLTGRAERLVGMEAWRALLAQTFDVTHPWAEWAGRRLHQTRVLAQQTPIWRLSYTRSPDGVARHMEALEALMRGEVEDAER